MGLTYDKLIRLAQALNVDLKDIVMEAEESPASVAVGRRSVTRAGEELDADVAACGAERAAQANLRAALEHRDDHHVGDPDAAD